MVDWNLEKSKCMPYGINMGMLGAEKLPLDSSFSAPTVYIVWHTLRLFKRPIDHEKKNYHYYYHH